MDELLIISKQFCPRGGFHSMEKGNKYKDDNEIRPDIHFNLAK